MENKLNTPRWNMDSIYPSLDCKEYKEALETYKSSIKELESLLDTADKFTREANSNFDFAGWLATYIKKDSESSALISTLEAYSYCIYSTDTTNTEYLNNLSTIDELSTLAIPLGIRFETLLVAHQVSLDEFYTRFPEYAEFKYTLEECIENSKHRMSAAEEKLAADMSHTGGDAWGMLQEQLTSNMHDENGRTFNDLRNDAYENDPKVRRTSWEKETALLAQNRIAFAASLNNLKGETVTLNKKRHWDAPIDRSLFFSRCSKETLNALISSLEEALPMWRDYFKAKAKILRKAGATASETAGTPEHPGIAFYDLFAPLPNPDKNAKDDEQSPVSKRWTFDEARDYVIKEYYSFSDDMGDFAKHAFENQWIDAEIRPGKVGGAYDQDFAKGHQSRILANFSGDFGGIITLAHELGHAYHFSCLKGKNPAFFNYPMTLAESASTFAETIVKQDMLSSCSGFDRMRILDLDLTDASQVLVDILCRYKFEQSVFENRMNTELNADDFCRLMQEAQESTYGSGLNDVRTEDGTNYAERHDYMWAVKGHYYSTGLDFYNFPYAFGQLFAAGLYARSRKEGREFAKTYAQILSNTGSMSCEEVCAKAGFDITKKDFWKAGIEMYAKEVAEFKAFADKL